VTFRDFCMRHFTSLTDLQEQYVYHVDSLFYNSGARYLNFDPSHARGKGLTTIQLAHVAYHIEQYPDHKLLFISPTTSRRDNVKHKLKAFTPHSDSVHFVSMQNLTDSIAGRRYHFVFSEEDGFPKNTVAARIER